MANGQAWLNTTHIRLRDNSIADGHAMPIGLMPQCNIGALVGVIVFSAQGGNVPISRGSPPISG